MIEVNYPVKFEDLLEIVCGNNIRRSMKISGNNFIENERGRLEISGASYIEPKIEKEYTKWNSFVSYDGDVSSNLVEFLVNFGDGWEYLNKEDRETTLNSLKYLYECLEKPFKMNDGTHKSKEMFKHILNNIELTKELSNAINHFHNLTYIYLVPRLAKINEISIKGTEILTHKKDVDYTTIDTNKRGGYMEANDVINGFRTVNVINRENHNLHNSLATMVSAKITSLGKDIKEEKKMIAEHNVELKKLGVGIHKRLGNMVEEEKKRLDEKRDEMTKYFNEWWNSFEERNKEHERRMEERHAAEAEEMRQYVISCKERDERVKKNNEEAARKIENELILYHKNRVWWLNFHDAYFDEIGGYKWIPLWIILHPFYGFWKDLSYCYAETSFQIIKRIFCGLVSLGYVVVVGSIPVKILKNISLRLTYLDEVVNNVITNKGSGIKGSIISLFGGIKGIVFGIIMLFLIKIVLLNDIGKDE